MKVTSKHEVYESKIFTVVEEEAKEVLARHSTLEPSA